jgi:acyl-coenzyme A thioesterase 13
MERGGEQDGSFAPNLPRGALGTAFLRTLVDGSVRSTFDHVALRGCEVHDIRGEAGAVSCKVWVRPPTENMFSTMHGGCHATLIDVVSTAALVTVTGRPGVSVSLSISYLRPGRANAELEVRSHVVKYGKKLGTIVTDIVDLVSGETLVTGTHIKAMSSSEQNLATSKL